MLTRCSKKETQKNRFGRINPREFSELHSYVKYYLNVYWLWDAERELILLELIKEIEYLYCKLYPKEPPIEKNRNVRNAGRPRKYDSKFDDDIMDLYHSGYTLKEIVEKKGCSKSYVSKLIKKRRSSGIG